MNGRGYLERVILGEDRSAVSWVIRALFWPLSLIYRAGLALFLAVYSLGLRKRHRLSVPVISVGNLTFGGTGKTPVVQAICRMLMEQGKKVCILSRGHGGAARQCLVVSDGISVQCDARESGDEPMLLATSLPGVSVVVGKDRRVSGDLACRTFAPDVVVLDDGLQYWQLHRDLDVVVLDAAHPFGSGFVMPMGDLRVPIGTLAQADVVLLNNSGGVEAEDYARIEKRVTRLARHAAVFRCDRRPESLVRFGNKIPETPQTPGAHDTGAQSTDLGLEWIRGRRVAAFCGIGRPGSFKQMLESLGAVVETCIMFPDHHEFSDKDIALVENERESSGADILVTTEKDAARLQGSPAISDLDVYVLSIEIEIEGTSRFAEYIAKGINKQD